VNPCSSRSRSNTRFAVCRCLRWTSRSPSSQLSMIPVKPSSFGRLIGADRRYPGGTENAIILATLSREMLKCRAASRWLMPSAQASRTFRYKSTVKILPPSLSPERVKVDDFYAARSRLIPPLPWPTFAPPFSAGYIDVETNAGKRGTNVYVLRLNPAGDTPPHEVHPAGAAPHPRTSCTPTPAGASPEPSSNPQEPSESNSARKIFDTL